jgi:hypothetical protein
MNDYTELAAIAHEALEFEKKDNKAAKAATAATGLTGAALLIRHVKKGGKRLRLDQYTGRTGEVRRKAEAFRKHRKGQKPKRAKVVKVTS